MDRLVGFLRDNGVKIPGIVGPESEARCFAVAWVKANPGLAAAISTRLRVFEARSVVDVPLAPGSLRLAEDGRSCADGEVDRGVLTGGGWGSIRFC